MLRSTLAFAAAVLSATPAVASSYSAVPQTPITARIITGDITWNCGSAACQGSTDESRPLVLCESLARRAGKIDSFLVNGEALPAADLAKCNASAKAQPARALASQ